MLDPRHSCSWTNKKRSDLVLYRDESRLYTAGLSTRVLLSAFGAPNIVWYSTVYGEYRDNLDALATLSGFESGSGAKENYVEPGPVSRIAEDLFPVEEYVLTDSVAEQVGLVYVRDEENDSRLSRLNDPHELPRDAVCLIYAHDDCYCSLFPASRAHVQNVLDQTLNMHSFHLGRKIDWSGERESIVEILFEHSAIRLQSHEAKGRNDSVTSISVPGARWSGGSGSLPKFNMAFKVNFPGGRAKLQPRATRFGK